MVAADFSDYLQFVLTDPRHCGNNSFYTATDALLNLEAEVVQKDETQAKGEERTQKQIERLPVIDMLRKYGLGEEREHLLLAGKPGSGKSTTLRRLCVEMAEIALGDNLQPIPVFVQLKGDKPIVKLIQAEFRRAKLKVTDEQIDDLLLEDKLVLLLDGVNEIPSEELRRELQDFRENNLTTPTIFTTRDLTVGGSLGIDKRLEMRPLTDSQMREFVHKYLPEHGDKLLGQLRDRLREIAETPLLLKMLCEVFEPQTGQIPQNKAELFELFDRKYQRHKEGVPISADFRRFQSEILQYLAFTMLQGDAAKPTEAWLTLSRHRAEGIIEAWLKQRNETNPASKAKEWLEDLVEYHLLQVATDPHQIEFHHQLFQEYYAARQLRSILQDKHPDLVDDDRLKHFYLNYLKWTGPLGLLLGLLDDEAQALRLVGLGLEVDWFLGARLAGDVKQGFQPQTVGLIDRLIEEKDLPQWLRFELWEKTRSSLVLSKLLPLLQHSDSWVRASAIGAISRLGDRSNVPELLRFLQDSDSWLRTSAIMAISQLGDRSNVTDLLPLLDDIWDIDIRAIAMDAISQLGDRSNVTDLLPFLKHLDSDVRFRAVRIISRIGDGSNIPDLLPLLEDCDSGVRSSAIEAIDQLRDRCNVPNLLPLLQDSGSSMKDRIASEIPKLDKETINLSDLFFLLRNSDSNVRSRAISDIVQLEDRSNIKKIIPLLQDSSHTVRSKAINAVARLGDESNFDDLLPLLHDLELYLRINALKAIDCLANKSHVSALIPFLEDLNYGCRWKIIEVIKNIGDTSAIPYLEPLRQDSDSYVRFWSEIAIGELTNNMDITKLEPFLQCKHFLFRLNAINAIVHFGNAKNVSLLISLLQDEDYNIISAATEAIEILADQTFLPYFHQKLAESSDNRIILAIQARCEFYNYDIFRIPPASQRDKIESNKTENHFPNATEVKIFENVDRYYQTPHQDLSS